MRAKEKQLTLKSNTVFLDTYIRETSIGLNTINYIFDGEQAARDRGLGFRSLGNASNKEMYKQLKQDKTSYKWMESSTNYDNHWMALREAHIEWERLNRSEHSLSAILMNLENCPVNMGTIKDAPPAETFVSCGFKILPKLNPDDRLVNTFYKYNSKLKNCVFKMTVKSLNFI